MSQYPYQIRGVVADGEYLSQSIAQYYERHYITVTFFSDEYINPVIPTGGTITFTATDDGFNFGTPKSPVGGVVQASDPAYTRPNFGGKIQKVKATTSGITGATHFIAVINSYN